MKQFVISLAVAIIVILGAYLLVRPTSAPQTSPTLSTTSVESSPTPEASATASPSPEKMVTSEPTMAAEAIRVNMNNMKFSPSLVAIKAGRSYKLTLSSKGPHTFTVDKLNIDFVVGSGETQTFDLTVAKAGTYELYCATPGHKEAGMVGKLVVQ